MTDRTDSARPLRPARRGRPVIVLALVLGGWSLLRAATWDNTVGQDSPATPDNLPLVAGPAAVPVIPGTGERAAESLTPLQRQLPRRPGEPLAAPPSTLEPLRAQPLEPFTGAAVVAPPVGTAQQVQPVSPRMAVGHALLLAAGFGAMQLPPELAAYFTPRTPGAAGHPRTPAPTATPGEAGSDSAAGLAGAQRPLATGGTARAASRWSADGWLLWRDDTTTPITSGRPTYGRSQAGAVARYRLSPANPHAPQAHLRVAGALQGTREREAALGLSARPLAQVPVRVMAEVRASERVTGTELRPAVMAVTELAPQALPLGASAEAYGAAGYVGGRARTAFADGQLRVERSLVQHEDFDLRAGGGAWGGAQRGSARLDVGPSASVSFDLGEARGRLAADYRVRVAGDARPASGPALTLSAGF